MTLAATIPTHHKLTENNALSSINKENSLVPMVALRFTSPLLSSKKQAGF